MMRRRRQYFAGMDLKALLEDTLGAHVDPATLRDSAQVPCSWITRWTSRTRAVGVVLALRWSLL
jgi:hypothetical protein